MTIDIGPEHWTALAREELEVARTCSKKPHWQATFHHAGFALECALKCKIMRVTGMNRWPDYAERKDLYSHDLRKLAVIAGVDRVMDAALKSKDSLGINWLVATDWSNSVRYDPTPFPAIRGEDMLKAVDQGGLIEWLLKA